MKRMMTGLLALGLALAAAPSPAQVPAPSAAADAATRALFGQASERRDPAATVAVGFQVATSADPRATAAGVEMLRRGGSAADAAAAMLLALNVVEPQSSGIGGGGFLLYHDAATGQLHTLDGRETAPAAATPQRFIGADGKPQPFREAVPGGKSVGVPGNVRLVEAMHRRWGKLPWPVLFEPAIRLARDGFDASERFTRFVGFRPDRAPQFLGTDGKPLPPGTRIRQPELAATFEAIAKQGADAFYTGPIAEGVVQAVTTAKRNPADMTLADLATYRVAERAPVCGSYRIWRICGMGPPSSGGIAVIQILKQLERYNMTGLGPDNPLSWHLIAESMRLAMADREAWLGDPDFVPVPTKGLISDAYIAERARLISAARAMPSVSAGTPPGAPPRAPAKDSEVPSTTHFDAVDAAGNVASLTSTIEGVFGSGLVTGGFFLNNELTDFDFVPARDGVEAMNRVQAGKRPRSSMAPTIVYDRDGRVVMAVGAAGGATIIAQVAKALIATLDWGLPVEEALAVPQIFAVGDRLSLERGTRLESMIPTFKALGHKAPAAADMPLKANVIGAVDAGRWRGAADPRSEGQAMSVDGAGASAERRETMGAGR